MIRWLPRVSSTRIRPHVIKAAYTPTLKSSILPLRSSFRLKQAFKATLAAVITAAFVYYFQVPQGYFAVLSSFVLMVMFYDELLSKGLQRILGPLFAAILALLFLRFIPHNLISHLVLLFTGSAFFIYLYALEKFAYAFLLGAITFIFVATTSLVDSYSQAVSLAYHWIFGIIIAVVISLLIHQLLWPRHLKPAICKRLSQLLEIRKHTLMAGFDNFIYHSANKIPVSIHLGFEIFNRVLTLINLNEDPILARSVSLVRNLSLKIKELALISEQMHPCIPLEIYTEDLQNLKLSLLGEIETIQRRLDGHQVNDLEPPQTNVILNTIKEKFSAQRKIFAYRDTPLSDLFGFISLLNLVEKISVVLDKLKNNILPSSFEPSTPFLAKFIPRKEVLVMIGRSDEKKQAAKQAFKVSTALLIIILINRYLNWEEFTLQALIATCVILAQTNLGRSYHRARLRIVGILLGGASGALGIFLVSLYPSYALLFCYLAINLLIFAYFSLGSERYAYAGLQAGMMLCFTLIVSPTIVGHLTIGMERLVGCFEGIAVGLLVLHFLYPAHPYKIIKKQLADSLHLLANLFQLLISNNQEDIRKKIAELRNKVETQLLKNIQLAHETQYLLYGDKEYINKILNIISLYDAILMHLQLLESALLDKQHLALIEYFFKHLSQTYFTSVYSAFNQIAAKLMGENSTVAPLDLTSINAALEQVVEQFHAARTTRNYTLEELENYAALVTGLKQMHTSISELNVLVAGL